MVIWFWTHTQFQEQPLWMDRGGFYRQMGMLMDMNLSN